MNTSLRLRLSLLLVFLCLTPAYPLWAAVFYVDAAATGANNGSSWTDAYNYLQDALTAAGSGTEIWVAQGAYRPDMDTAHPGGTNDRTATFQLKNGVALYGGFPTGGGGSRDPNTYVTSLSGDINVQGNNSDNSYHVVTGSGTDSTVVLDGFTITQGYADGLPPDNRGAGMVNNSGSPMLTNCIFSGNSAVSDEDNCYGGGIYNDSSNPTLTNCIFSGNSAASYGLAHYGYGGGMYNDSGSPTLTNCTFTGNQTYGENASYGSGMYNNSGNPNMTNCSFTNNLASDNGCGGGIYNNVGGPTLTRCTFTGNQLIGPYSCYGGGIYNAGGSPTLTNCNFTNNKADNYSWDGHGGGIYNAGGSPTLTNCTFSGNSASSGLHDGGYGGGLCNDGGNLNITNCMFSGNHVSGGDPGSHGGGIYNAGGTSNITNCTFTGNSTGGFNDSGGGIYNTGSNPNIVNCILWANTAPTGPQIYGSATVSFSDVQGGWTGTGNINADPLFINANNNLRLSFGSPCIDAGDNNSVPPDTADLDGDGNTTEPTPLDLDLHSRFVGGDYRIVDMGAYEFSGPQAYNPTPADGAIGVGVTTDLTWTAGTGAVSHDVYFGTTSPGTFQGNQPGTTFDPCTLDFNTTYYWRVDEVNSSGTTTGIVWMFTTTTPSSNRIYVDAGASGANNGSSWANAYKYLQNALTAASPGYPIWVAQGTYRPDASSSNPGGTNDRTATFQLKNNVSIYGGFPTGGGQWESRNPNTYVTSLSGDIGVPDNGSDNSYHVVTGSDTNSTAVLDGFTITKGYANISNSGGGGMFNSSGSPTVTNCTFIDNSGHSFGGGMYNRSSSPTITNCTFTGNSGSNSGGGMYNYPSGNPTITNCTFIGNAASSAGGGMCNGSSSNPTLANCILWGNTADVAYGPQIWGPATVRFSDVQGGWTGTGNINKDPLLVDANGPDNIPGTEDDNLRLSSNSPCIDKGNNASVPADIADLDGDANKTEQTPLDLDLRPRFVDGDCNSTIIVDMGAFEFTHAYFGDFDSDCDVDFYDYAILAASWLQNDSLTDIAPTPAGDGIVDTSDLAVLCDNWLESF